MEEADVIPSSSRKVRELQYRDGLIRSIPDTWVTVYSGDMGDSLVPTGCRRQQSAGPRLPRLADLSNLDYRTLLPEEALTLPVPPRR